jgi:hypothetical protein
MACHPEPVEGSRAETFAHMLRQATYDMFVKTPFVILNAVKDLLSAILLRPVRFANRSFVPQDDKLF